MFNFRDDLISSCNFLCAREPLRGLKGGFSAYFAYPIAERLEKRLIRSKLYEIKSHYNKSFEERLRISQRKLFDILSFSEANVPYYRDLFNEINFKPINILRDIKYLKDVPYLTKDVIREQGNRLLSYPLESTRHYACKTGGSTGSSVVVYYDQVAADYSAAVTLYCRENVGALRRYPEVHFACRFPGSQQSILPTRETWKCLAMNRSNIFFDSIDDAGLEEIWTKLKCLRPHLIHGHPSTIYALACYIERSRGHGKAFQVFESSGELLQEYMRDKISKVLACDVVNRYGLAELGVMAYEIQGSNNQLQVLDSEGWPESRHDSDGDELVFTGFRNRLMPLIRYATGDRARVVQADNGYFLTDVVGRIHDTVPINGVLHATHYIMDILDHVVKGVQEFQVDLRYLHPILRIVPEPNENNAELAQRINRVWPDAFMLEFVGHHQLVRVGRLAKFRHVVRA